MSENPLFSVLIANYNNGHFLMEAVDSVKAQTYPNWEIILVDDGSTDDSLELYKQLEQDSRIHVFLNGENKGCGYTKRRCAELANGELCGFLDPDDVLEPDALQVMVKEHLANEDASLVYSRFFDCDNQLKIIAISESQKVIPQGSSFLEFGRGSVTSFAAFKKKSYDLTQGINPSIKRAVDHDLYYLLEEVGKLSFVDKPIYRYRTNSGNNISTGANIYAAFMWDLLVKADACQRRGLDVEAILVDSLKGFVEYEKRVSSTEGESPATKKKTALRLEQHIVNARACRMQHEPWLGEFMMVLFYTPFSIRKGFRGIKKILAVQ